MTVILTVIVVCTLLNMSDFNDPRKILPANTHHSDRIFSYMLGTPQLLKSTFIKAYRHKRRNRHCSCLSIAQTCNFSQQPVFFLSITTFNLQHMYSAVFLIRQLIKPSKRPNYTIFWYVIAPSNRFEKFPFFKALNVSKDPTTINCN